MSKKYVVKVTAVQGIGKTMHRAGAIVTDECFPKGNAAELVKSGHIAEVGKDESKDDINSAKGKKKSTDNSKE